MPAASRSPVRRPTDENRDSGAESPADINNANDPPMIQHSWAEKENGEKKRGTAFARTVENIFFLRKLRKLTRKPKNYRKFLQVLLGTLCVVGSIIAVGIVFLRPELRTKIDRALRKGQDGGGNKCDEPFLAPTPTTTTVSKDVAEQIVVGVTLEVGEPPLEVGEPLTSRSGKTQGGKTRRGKTTHKNGERREGAVPADGGNGDKSLEDSDEPKTDV